jgi:hypothetical protein
VGSFDADGSLGTVGTTVKLTTVGAPTPHVTETTVARADAPKVLEYNWSSGDIRWKLEALGGATRLTLWATASSRWVLPDGTFVSMFWIASSEELPSAASLVLRA